MDYKEIARQMCGVASWYDIPQGARDHLDMTDRLCKRLDGGLVSRQAVASVLAPYLMPLNSPYTLATEEPK